MSHYYQPVYLRLTQMGWEVQRFNDSHLETPSYAIVRFKDNLPSPRRLLPWVLLGCAMWAIALMTRNYMVIVLVALLCVYWATTRIHSSEIHLVPGVGITVRDKGIWY